jgi:type IV pilus assembly protein PilV
MSLCLLGIAALLAATTRFQLGVNSRAQLTLLLNDAAGRIRANVSEIPGYDTATHAAPYTYSANWATQQGSIAAAAVDCATTTCTPSQRASWDLVALRSAARSALPQGSMLMSGNINVLTVTYLWMDKDFTTGNPPVLRTSSACATGNTGIQAQTCCPVAAAVSSTPGVRCFNMDIMP